MDIIFLTFPPSYNIVQNSVNRLKHTICIKKQGEKIVKMYQGSLFYDLQYFVETSTIHKKYYLLFKSLDLSNIPDINSIGRTRYSHHAIFRALIIKHLEGIKSISKLIEFLDAHPVLAEMCGFKTRKFPNESQFYRFLQKIPNSLLENIHHKLNKKLIDENVISLTHFIADSKPILAATRDNNFKNPNRNTHNKNKKPKRNLSATLSYYSYQTINGKKNNYIFFWGYRTHVIISKEGIPLVEKTFSNNITDAKVAMTLIKKLKRVYKFKKKSFFIADAAYDVKELYNLIVNQFKSQAFIPINPRNQQKPKTFGPHGLPLCQAGIEMKSNGILTEAIKFRIRAKFRCPIITDSKIAYNYPNGCPIACPKFFEGKAYGCTKYLDITNDARSQVSRDTAFFKNTYNLRTEVERYFARLGDRELEQTTHYKFRSIQNQTTIAHLSMSLVACAAALLLKKPDQIRCYRTFANDPPLSQSA